MRGAAMSWSDTYRSRQDDESARRRKIKRAQIKRQSQERRAASRARTARRKKVKQRAKQLKKRQKQSLKMISEFSPAALGPDSPPSVHSIHIHSRPVQGRPAPAPTARWSADRKHLPSVLRWKDAGDFAQLRFCCRAV